MGHELKGREIFATGTWNGIEFTEDDLDELIFNFDALKDNFKVPLKFGHDEDHKELFLLPCQLVYQQKTFGTQIIFHG